MGLYCEKIDGTLWLKRVLDTDKIRRKSKTHKWMKRCMNKLMRIQAKKIDLSPDDLNLTPKKRYVGWEY